MIPKYRVYCHENNSMILAEDYEDVSNLFIALSSDDSLFSDVMQSTGLFSTCYQDELFKDDIISWDYHDEWKDSGTARIVYKDGCWKLCDIKTGKEVWDSLYDCLQNCTVFLVGNIHQHPHLLEGYGR